MDYNAVVTVVVRFVVKGKSASAQKISACANALKNDNSLVRVTMATRGTVCREPRDPQFVSSLFSSLHDSGLISAIVECKSAS